MCRGANGIFRQWYNDIAAAEARYRLIRARQRPWSTAALVPVARRMSHGERMHILGTSRDLITGWPSDGRGRLTYGAVAARAGRHRSAPRSVSGRRARRAPPAPFP